MKKARYETDEKLCPFRKKVGRSVRANEVRYIDLFGKCVGDRCMAFSNGTCLRFHEEKEIAKRKTN